MFRLRFPSLAVFAVLALAAAGRPAVAADPPAKADPVKADPTDEQLKATALKLNALTDMKAMNARLAALTKDAAGSARLVRVAAGMQKGKGAKDAPFKYNAALVLATLARNVKEYPAAETFFEWCLDYATRLKSSDQYVTSYLGLMRTYTVQKKYAAAEELAQKVLDAEETPASDGFKELAMRQLIEAKAKQGDLDAAVEMVDKLIALEKNGYSFAMTKAGIYRDAGKTDEAIAAYEDVGERIKKSRQLDDDEKEQAGRQVRYIISSVYVDAKKIDKAAAILEELIDEDPDDAGYRNDLGFIWADAGKNLDKAETLIRKALDLDAAQRQKALADGKMDKAAAAKENAAYVDSLGWVLYKRGKYAEALKYLEKAFQDPDQGDHLEIYDHVADCQAALGKKKEAVETWQKGLKLEDVSNRDAERRKAVQAKLKKLQAELKK